MLGSVFVTGATGFVGQAIVRELLSRDRAVHALIQTKALLITNERLQRFNGDIFDQTTLGAAMAGCDAVIHLVGIIKETPSKNSTFDRIHNQGTASVVTSAKEAGISRFIQMSALGTRVDAVSEYHRTKYLAEQHVRNSGLDWTIFRPSMIHGPTGEFSRMEIEWASKRRLPFLFMPYFGRGLLGLGPRSLIQPIYIDDIARAFVDALEKPDAIGEVFPLGGPDPITWPQMHEIFARAVVGHARWTLPIPAWYAKAIASVVPAALLPFNVSQVQMAEEDSVCDLTKFTNLFGWTPRPFEESVQSYARR